MSLAPSAPASAIAPLSARSTLKSSTPASRSSTIKSCLTPSTLTEYSSTSPGRTKVTDCPATATLPMAGRETNFVAPRPMAVAVSFNVPPPASVEASESPSRVTVPASF